MNKKNITILMQGPIYRATETLKHYNYYINQGFNVLISTWSGKEERKLINCNKIVKKLPEIFTSIDYNIEYPEFRNPPEVDIYDRKWSSYYQVCSILNGLDNITTDYVIKTRNDSFYSKLDHFAQVLLDNTDNYVCNNIFFRSDALAKFHPSDHLIGMTKDTMYQVMVSIKNFIDVYHALGNVKNRDNPDSILANNGNFQLNLYAKEATTAIEIIFMRVFLIVKGIKIDERISKKIMKENVSLVPLSELGEYKFQWNSVYGTYTNIPNEYMTNLNRWDEKVIEYPLIMQRAKDYEPASKKKNVPLSDGCREFIPEANKSIRSMDEL